MSRYTLAYLATLAVLLACDVAYLGGIGQALFRDRIGDLMLDRPKLSAAASFYLLYPVGVLIFAVAPAWAAARPGKAIIQGALFGLFAYATYDLTNLATLRGWTIGLAAADIAWGTALTGIAALAGYAAGRG